MEDLQGLVDELTDKIKVITEFIKEKGDVIMANIIKDQMQNNQESGTRMISEQGDLGLWNTPLNEKDQKTYNEQVINEEKK